MNKRIRKPTLSILSVLVSSLTLVVGFMLLAASTSPARAFGGDYALHFDGETDFVDLGPTSDILGNNWQVTKTISLWVRPDTAAPIVTDTVDGNMILGDHPRWFGIYHANTTGEDRIWVINVDGSSADGTPFGVAFPIAYTIGEWVHIALTHGNGTFKVYRNGVEVGSAAIGPTANGHPGAIGDLRLRFGGSISLESNGYIGPFDGQIDEVRIYSATLTGDQIRQDMYRTLQGSDPLLSAYYQMSNGSGTTVTDDSGNGHTGTMYDGFGVIVPPDGDYAAWVSSSAFAGPRNTLDFDGTNDYVELGANSNSVIGSSWDSTKSVSLWINPAGSAPSVTDAASGSWIFGAHDGSNARWGISRAQIGAEDKIWVWNNDGNEDRIGIDYTANEWTQVTLVHSGGTLTAYKNGLEIASVASGNTSGDGTLYISGLPGGQNFPGQVDELRVWDFARTKTEIQNDAFHTLAHNQTGLVAYYRFDQDNDSTNTNLYNAVSNNFTGTLTNMDPALDWVASTAFNTWIGDIDSDWANGANWSRYTAPTSTDNVGVHNYVASNPPVIGSVVNVSNMAVATSGSLAVDTSGSLSVAGALLNYGTLALTQSVDGSGTVSFFNTGNYGGLTIDPASQNLGETTVTIQGNQDCTTVAGETVQRCFDITSTTSPVSGTTLTFYFDSDELSTYNCTDLEGYHWNGSTWELLPRDASYGIGGRMCGSNPQSIQVTGVTNYSPFSLKDSGSPNAITLESFSGKPAHTALLVPALGIFIFLGSIVGFSLRKRKNQGTN